MSEDHPVSENYPSEGFTSESLEKYNKLISSYIKKSVTQNSIDELKKILTSNPFVFESVNVDVQQLSESEKLFSLPEYTYPQKANITMSEYPVVPVSSNVYKTTIQPFVSPEGASLDLNLFINHDPSLPPNVIVIDYVNSGELFCNMSYVHINHALPALNKLYRSYLNVGDFINPALPLGYTSSRLSYAVTCKSPTNPDSIAWSFPLEKFFNYNPILKDLPVCEYYTHQSIDNSVPVVISSHYKYANVVSGMHSCSHPVLSQSSPECFNFNSLSSCPSYSPLKTELLSNKISSDHSSSEINFSLTYSLTCSGKHMFAITNNTINEDVNVLVYPSSYSYDQCLTEATTVYHEYINPYLSNFHTVSENEKSNISDSTKDLEKESYINSLLVG